MALDTMDLTIELRLVAGLGALFLGSAALLGALRRVRGRRFWLLCAALAIWNLGVVGRYLRAPTSAGLWARLALLGLCAAAPLALHLALRLRRASRAIRRALLWTAYGLSTVLWLSAWTAVYDIQPYWNLITAATLGGILATALVFLGLYAFALPKGPEGTAYRLLFGGAVVATLGGLSDFIPRNERRVPFIDVAVLLFLVLACAIIVRHRFLDPTTLLTRLLAVLAGAIMSGLLVYSVILMAGQRLLPLIVASGIILMLVQPAWRLLNADTGILFSGSNPVTRGLIKVSHGLTRAQDRAAMMHAVREGRRLLPEGVQLGFYLRRTADERFHLAYRVARDPMPASIESGSPLSRFVAQERTPVTKRFLAEEVEEARGSRREGAQAALEQMRELRAELIVPVFHGDILTGCLSLGGDVDPQYLTAELADTFLAVSNQAMESLERIEALEQARQREALAAVGEMAAGLAHEIRNPVAAIRGAAQLLLEEDESTAEEKRTGEMLEVIQQETAQLGRVVSDFLEYANPRGRGRRPVDIADELRRAIRAAEVAGMGLAGGVRVDPDTPAVIADAEQLHRIFCNLIWNAREAAGPDGHLQVEVAPDGSGRVSIRFEDDGGGIPPSEMTRLFKPFHTTKAHGTGLGLALVHRLVEAHDGEIHVEGRPGRGAVFTIILPTGART